MKLYDCKTAPSPRRVRIFLAEKGLSVDTVEVDLGNGEQFSDAFRAVNPDCTVPVLELEDGVLITDVLGICRYLEALKPEPALFGSSAVEQGLTTMWNSKVEQQGLMAMADAFRNSVAGLKGRALPGAESYEQIPELAVRGRQRVLRFLDKMNRRLGESTYLAGEHYSIADITALVFVDFAKRGKLHAPEDAAALARWYEAVSGRPSAQA
ncbi:MAG: glutathione S-transferase [Pseudomonadota bacterium]